MWTYWNLGSEEGHSRVMTHRTSQGANGARRRLWVLLMHHLKPCEDPLKLSLSQEDKVDPRTCHEKLSRSSSSIEVPHEDDIPQSWVLKNIGIQVLVWVPLWILVERKAWGSRGQVTHYNEIVSRKEGHRTNPNPHESSKIVWINHGNSSLKRILNQTSNAC